MIKLYKYKLSTALLSAIFIFSGCGGGGGSSTTPSATGELPEIIMHGDTNYIVNIGEDFNDPGVNAKDPQDGDITDKVLIEHNVDLFQEGIYNIKYSVTDSDNHTITKKRTIKVDDPYTVDSKFDTIRSLIQLSSTDEKNDVNYICIGDSTRAESNEHKGEYLFYEIRDKLKEYNVTSHLIAKSGMSAKEFLNTKNEKNYKDAIDVIPSKGENSIVDISLGINDVWKYNDSSVESIKFSIKSIIEKIKDKKPDTNFMLTMPNRNMGKEDATQIYKDIYIQLADELNLPLNNVIDELMPTKDETNEDWFRKGDGSVHLSRDGQHAVAQFILRNILP